MKAILSCFEYPEAKLRMNVVKNNRCGCLRSLAAIFLERRQFCASQCGAPLNSTWDSCLMAEGAQVRAYDPQALAKAQNECPRLIPGASP
jgi:hypothetical protein